jgi:hypothetical protein
MTDRSTTTALKGQILLQLAEKQLEAGKWLLSSLLIVNGGAIVALLSNEKFGGRILAEAGLYYALGVILAFLAGGFSWVESEAYLGSLRSQLGIKLYVGENLPKKSWYGRNYGMIWGVGASSFGIGSLGLFAYATITAAFAMPVS